MGRSPLCRASGALLLVATASAGAAEPAALLAQPCYGCHRAEDVGRDPIPDLNRLSADEIDAALRAFKAGTRPGSIMGRIAVGYSADELRAIAEYIARHRGPP